MDADDLFEPGDRAMVGFELNDVIKQLENLISGFLQRERQEKWLAV